MMSLEIISGKAQSSDEPSQENCLPYNHRCAMAALYLRAIGRGFCKRIATISVAKSLFA